MKHLLKQLKAYRKESILGPLFKLLEAGFELLVPLLVAAMIDQGVKLGDKSVIVRMSLMMVGLGLIGRSILRPRRRSARRRACGGRCLRTCRRSPIRSWIRSARPRC